MAYGTQVAVRLDRAALEALDRLVAERQFSSRADAVRHAVHAFLDASHRAAEGARIADGYRRHPQTDADDAAAEAHLRALIAEEPW